MSGNPKSSPWYSTPQSARARKRVELTLSEAALARLSELAEQLGISRSQVIERLLKRGNV